jgi:hypothetical protein
MTMGNVRGLTLIAAVGVAFLMVFVLPTGVAAAAGPSGAGAGGTIWAYGDARTITFSGTTASGWEYSGQATFGYAVILSQINTSSDGNTFELTLNRTMGVVLTEEACYPSCAHAVYAINESFHSWETTDAWANFTLEGTVLEGSTAVPAIALETTNTQVSAHLVERNSTSVASAVRTRTLLVNVTGDANIAFTTPLGLLPENLSLSTPASWTSSSAFTASGSADWGYFFSSVGPLHDVSLSHNGSAAVNGSGSVTAKGSYSLGNSVSFGGIAYPAVQLTILGPFSVREGIIFVPTGGDLFGGKAQPWSDNQSGTAVASQTALDALPTSGGHFGLVASAWLYSASGSTGTSAGMAPGVGGVSSPATAPVPATAVQGVPQSPSDAQATQNCLATGSACPAGGTTGSTSTGGSLPRGLFLLAGVVVVVVVVGAVLVAERRRMPPPAYPNAGLYPPGSPTVAPRPGTARPENAPPPASEDDPLSHLW